MAVREAASEAPSKMTQTLVERLRQQLSVKEKQQKVRLSCGSLLFLVTLSLSLSGSKRSSSSGESRTTRHHPEGHRKPHPPRGHRGQPPENGPEKNIRT